MHLSNVLTNFNSSLTNSNNTSEPCSEQNVSPTTSTTPPKPPTSASPPPSAVSPVTKFGDDPLQRQSSKSSNSKSNNGHCIRTDSNANNRDADDEVAHRVSELHHQSPDLCCVGVHIGLPNASDDAPATTDIVINADDNSGDSSGGGGGGDDDEDDDTILQQHDTSEIQSESTTASNSTAKAPPTEPNLTPDDSLDLDVSTKKHTPTDGINNGPANDVRV